MPSSPQARGIRTFWEVVGRPPLSLGQQFFFRDIRRLLFYIYCFLFFVEIDTSAEGPFLGCQWPGSFTSRLVSFAVPPRGKARFKIVPPCKICPLCWSSFLADTFDPFAGSPEGEACATALDASLLNCSRRPAFFGTSFTGALFPVDHRLLTVILKFYPAGQVAAKLFPVLAPLTPQEQTARFPEGDAPPGGLFVFTFFGAQKSGIFPLPACPEEDLLKRRPPFYGFVFLHPC